MVASLREVLTDKDKSALRLFLAIFFWFIGYAAVETFFTLYAKHHLGINEADGATLLSVMPLLFVLFGPAAAATPPMDSAIIMATEAAMTRIFTLFPMLCTPFLKLRFFLNLSFSIIEHRCGVIMEKRWDYCVF